jgi:hypothetical protein
VRSTFQWDLPSMRTAQPQPPHRSSSSTSSRPSPVFLSKFLDHRFHDLGVSHGSGSELRSHARASSRICGFWSTFLYRHCKPALSDMVPATYRRCPYDIPARHAWCAPIESVGARQHARLQSLQRCNFLQESDWVRQRQCMGATRNLYTYSVKMLMRSGTYGVSLFSRRDHH